MSDKYRHAEWILPDDKTIEKLDRPEKTSCQVRLTIVAGPHQGMERVFGNRCELVVGRSGESDLLLDQELHLSRRHFKLDIDPPRVRLIDLRSTNGTLVNDVVVLESTLTSGDRITVGETIIEIRIEQSEPSTDRPSEAYSTQFFSQLSQGQYQATESAPVESAPVNVQPSYETQYPTADLPTIDAYECIREIGKGGMAVVYEALHKQSQTTVAVKLIREEIGALSKLRQLFAREATILSKLNHPYIVKAHHLGFHERHLYLVMEYLPCLDLTVLVDSFEPNKKIRSACWIMQRVLEALSYSHNMGIVHRDIKPSNILGYREERHLKVKLSDFGLAKCYEDAGLGGLTDEKSIRGTLGYMSPEQFRDSRASGPEVDIYAAGACLARFLTGKVPSESLFNPNADLWAGVDFVPIELRQIVNRAMNHNVAKRFPDARTFAEAIAPLAQKP